MSGLTNHKSPPSTHAALALECRTHPQPMRIGLDPSILWFISFLARSASSRVAKRTKPYWEGGEKDEVTEASAACTQSNAPHPTPTPSPTLAEV